MQKDNLIRILEEHSQTWLSGEWLGKQMGITRAAVWKLMTQLKAEGYAISSEPHKGYFLCKENDVLSAPAVEQHLKHPECYHIEVHKSVTSTNDLLKKEAMKDAAEGTIIISEAQSAGKGRKGKTFYSPNQQGLYMSILLRPKLETSETLLITAAAAVAVHDAIQEVCHIDTDIKWVNDIYYQQRKLCGILCEASMEMETASFEWVVLGIGINCHEESFPDDLQDIATSLHAYTEKPFSRAYLAATVIDHFFHSYRHLSQRTYLHTYRTASCLLGKTITIYQNQEVLQGTAIDIDENGKLIVQMKGGRKSIFSGEVSVRQS